MMDSSDESLNREMNCPTIAGITAVRALGKNDSPHDRRWRQTHRLTGLGLTLGQRLKPTSNDLGNIRRREEGS